MRRRLMAADALARRRFFKNKDRAAVHHARRGCGGRGAARGSTRAANTGAIRRAVVVRRGVGEAAV